jgi:hypothetical protein
MPLMPQQRKKATRAATTGKHPAVDTYVATLLEKIKAGKQQLLFRKGEKIYFRVILPIPSTSFKAAELRSPSFQLRGRKLCWRCRGLMIFLVKGHLSSNLSG